MKEVELEARRARRAGAKRAYARACTTDLNRKPPHVRERAFRRWRELRGGAPPEGSAMYRAAAHKLLVQRNAAGGG
jgi:hypothetical protein